VLALCVTVAIAFRELGWRGAPRLGATLLVAGVKLVPLLFIAYLLHRRGLVFAGLMTCALTALLISPISWDHHWVWLAPGLALLIDAGHRASGAWYALAAAT
jgi:alpha-1,2-mannosyltransferase